MLFLLRRFTAVGLFLPISSAALSLTIACTDDGGSDAPVDMRMHSDPADPEGNTDGSDQNRDAGPREESREADTDEETDTQDPQPPEPDSTDSPDSGDGEDRDDETMQPDGGPAREPTDAGPEETPQQLEDFPDAEPPCPAGWDLVELYTAPGCSSTLMPERVCRPQIWDAACPVICGCDGQTYCGDVWGSSQDWAYGLSTPYTECGPDAGLF